MTRRCTHRARRSRFPGETAGQKLFSVGRIQPVIRSEVPEVTGSLRTRSAQRRNSPSNRSHLSPGHRRTFAGCGPASCSRSRYAARSEASVAERLNEGIRPGGRCRADCGGSKPVRRRDTSGPGPRAVRSGRWPPQGSPPRRFPDRTCGRPRSRGCGTGFVRSRRGRGPH